MNVSEETTCYKTPTQTHVAKIELDRDNFKCELDGNKLKSEVGKNIFKSEVGKIKHPLEPQLAGHTTPLEVACVDGVELSGRVEKDWVKEGEGERGKSKRGERERERREGEERVDGA